MFTSSNTHNPFAYTNQTMLEKYSTNEENPEEQLPSSFLHFPSPFLDYDGEFLLSQHLSPPQANISSHEDASKVGDEGTVATPLEVNQKKRKDGMKQPRKKTPKKKDRHSKIYTAQGLRDRRIRLSLQIARKFFDLQDMLGFDKASKTIEWLFSKSKSAIKELGVDHVSQVKHTNSGSGKSVSSASESEVMSGIVESLVDNKKKRKSHKLVACNSLAKESRDRARARARERTREKMVITGLKDSKQSPHENPKILSEHQMESVNIEGSFLATTNGSSEVISNNGFLGFPSNWDMMNNTRVNSTSTGNVHMQNPTDNFVPNSDTYEQNPSSTLMITSNTRYQNPSSFFMSSPNSQEQNPSSIFTTIPNICLQSHFIENRFPCNAMLQESRFKLSYDSFC